MLVDVRFVALGTDYCQMLAPQGESTVGLGNGGVVHHGRFTVALPHGLNSQYGINGIHTVL